MLRKILDKYYNWLSKRESIKYWKIVKKEFERGE